MRPSIFLIFLINLLVLDKTNIALETGPWMLVINRTHSKSNLNVPKIRQVGEYLRNKNEENRGHKNPLVNTRKLAKLTNGSGVKNLKDKPGLATGNSRSLVNAAQDQTQSDPGTADGEGITVPGICFSLQRP